VNGANGEEAARRRIRQILRTASLYAWGFFALAFATALGGAALVAWALTRAGLPFLESWLVVSTIVLLPSLLGIVWRALRDPTGRSSLPAGSTPDTPQERD
jgi:hypothetical protein